MLPGTAQVFMAHCVIDSAWQKYTSAEASTAFCVLYVHNQMELFAEMDIVAATLTAHFGNAKVDAEQELVLLQVNISVFAVFTLHSCIFKVWLLFPVTTLRYSFGWLVC